MKKTIIIVLVVLAVLLLGVRSLLLSTVPDNAPAVNVPVETAAASEQPAAQPDEVVLVQGETVAWAEAYAAVKTVKDMNGGVWGNVMIEIRNTGDTNISVASAHYDVEDPEGKLIHSNDVIAYPAVIEPGKSGYIYDEIILPDDSTDYVLIPKYDVVEYVGDAVWLDASDFRGETRFEGSFNFIGHIVNNTGADANGTMVAVVIFGDDGHPFAVYSDYSWDCLKAGAQIGFDFGGDTWITGLKWEDVPKYAVYAYEY